MLMFFCFSYYIQALQFYNEHIPSPPRPHFIVISPVPIWLIVT